MTQIPAPGAAARAKPSAAIIAARGGWRWEFRARRLILASGGFDFACVIERRGADKGGEGVLWRLDAA
jgi:hypothetical protein